MNTNYSIAAGTVDISPEDKIPLAGYATLRKPVFDKIADPLEANAVVIRDGRSIVAFAALDLMYVGPGIRDRVARALDGKITPDGLFLSAIHTHSAPPTDPSLPVLGKVTPAYVDYVAERVSSLLNRLLSEANVDAALSYRLGRASHSINRRLRVFGLGRDFPWLKWRYENRPNAAGASDEAIRVVRMTTEKGQDAAICWSYACHPVAFPRLDDVSADFPGAVRQILRKEFGPIPILYWHGFSGDIRPSASAAAGGKPRFRALSEGEWESWTKSLGARVVEVAREPGKRLEGALRHEARSLPLSDLGLPSPKRIGFREIRFGDDLSVCGVTAEVAVGYASLLQALRRPTEVIPVGCVDQVIGYLPTSAMVREGGYEARGFLPRFGISGTYRADVEEIVEKELFAAPSVHA